MPRALKGGTVTEQAGWTREWQPAPEGIDGQVLVVTRPDGEQARALFTTEALAMIGEDVAAGMDLGQLGAQ